MTNFFSTRWTKIAFSSAFACLPCLFHSSLLSSTTIIIAPMRPLVLIAALACMATIAHAQTNSKRTVDKFTLYFNNPSSKWSAKTTTKIGGLTPNITASLRTGYSSVTVAVGPIEAFRTNTTTPIDRVQLTCFTTTNKAQNLVTTKCTSSTGTYTSKLKILGIDATDTTIFKISRRKLVFDTITTLPLSIPPLYIAVCPSNLRLCSLSAPFNPTSSGTTKLLYP